VKEVKTAALAEIIPIRRPRARLIERIWNAWHDLEQRVVRDLNLVGKRSDGRDSKTLRQITCAVDLLPRGAWLGDVPAR